MNTKIMKITPVLLLAIIIGVLSPAAGFAQNEDFGTVKAAIDRTDEIISQAQGIIGESRSQIARISLDKAIAIQNKAKEFLQGQRYVFAHKYTMDARNEAWHAIALAREDARIEEKLSTVQENTRERLARLQTRVMESGLKDPALLRLMDEARDLLEKSRMNAVQLRNQLAMNLADNARKVTGQAEDRFRRTLTLKEMVERRLTLVERFMERARDRAEAQPGGMDSQRLQHAVKLTERTRELLRDGRYNAAKLTVQQSEKMVRAMVRDMSAVNGADPEAMLAEALRLQERARQMVTDNPDLPPESSAGVDRALQLLSRARNMIDAGKPDEARQLIEEARMMLRRALEPAGKGADAESVSKMISNMIEMRENVREMVARCGADGASSLFERASGHLDQAAASEKAGNIERARAEAGIARNLFQRIREICAG